jgi:hypothetical protein
MAIRKFPLRQRGRFLDDGEEVITTEDQEDQREDDDEVIETLQTIRRHVLTDRDLSEKVLAYQEFSRYFISDSQFVVSGSESFRIICESVFQTRGVIYFQPKGFRFNRYCEIVWPITVTSYA